MREILDLVSLSNAFNEQCLNLLTAPWYTNPQTVAFCSFIGLKNQINAPPPDTPPHNSEVPYPFSEEQEIKKIKAAAHAAMERKTKHYESSNDVLTLENDNEEEARWKEGSG